MKKPTILIIHGAGVRSYRVMHDTWLPYIKKSLNNDYDVVCPKMPNPQFPQYALWRGTIKDSLKTIQGPLILIGHSLGGTVLLKYLTEEAVPNPITGLFLIASPYFASDKGWNYQDFFIHKNPTELLTQFPVTSYHSSDDSVVPISHQGFFASKFPQFKVRALKDFGHEFSKKKFTEIVDDIRALNSRSSPLSL